jgi:hypothetical protein
MTFSYKRYYPDGRREFNLADYMHGKPKPRDNINSNNADLTYFTNTFTNANSTNTKMISVPLKTYKYYTGNFNKDGTAEYEIVTKEEGKKKNIGITLANLMRHRERQSFF